MTRKPVVAVGGDSRGRSRAVERRSSRGVTGRWRRTGHGLVSILRVTSFGAVVLRAEYMRGAAGPCGEGVLDRWLCGSGRVGSGRVEVERSPFRWTLYCTVCTHGGLGPWRGTRRTPRPNTWRPSPTNRQVRKVGTDGTSRYRNNEAPQGTGGELTVEYLIVQDCGQVLAAGSLF